ncbi:GNAT family N-acetyltransferase [Compostibacter hankyongensis]|uniref:N-acetyltransferase domain-containing protein n=1 Tax=Compostibacter hankyongensis TaxID=1007089 RepID=A0ABP8FLG6_9BACT
MEVKIIDYRPEHGAAFRRLNEAWLKKYFRVEPVDRQVLNHPEEYILRPGGFILLAECEGHIVGTVALKPEPETGLFEMTKMAVDEAWQGRGIGRTLGEALLERAWQMGLAEVILYSQTALAPAIRLYRKLGFEEIPLSNVHYKRCDIKMRKKR